jgi:triosephosphate isomerase
MIWVGTSWKMNKTLAEARHYASALAGLGPNRWPGVQPFVIPPATALAAVRAELGEHSPVLLGAQNAHWEDSGAWTGEVSVPQVADAGARIVELGHSERRAFFGETDETVNLKVKATLRHGLVPLVCVGEPSEVFDAGESCSHVLGQVRAAFAGVSELDRVLVAYEPIWAIGVDGRPAASCEIADVFAALHAEYGGSFRAVLYGGSVDRENALTTLAVPGVEGLFVGRAAWQAEGLVGLLDMVAGTL